MNRLAVSELAVVLILLLPASAQEHSPEWKTLEPGVQVLRLWETVGPAQPQIAILQLTSEKYKDFRRNPKDFVDGHKVFPEAVRPGARLTQTFGTPKRYTDRWVVTCFHRESYMRCASFPVEVEQRQNQHEKP